MKNEYTNLDSKKTGRKWWALIAILMVLAIAGGVYYFNFQPSLGLLHPSNAATKQSSEPDYPSDEELASYRSKVRKISYSISDLPDKTLLTQPESEEFESFHQSLMSKHGYNSEEHIIEWHVKDDKQSSLIAGKTASLSGLDCETTYAYMYDDGFLETTCDTDYSITGCISYEPYTSGNRWGETGYHGSDCYTNGYDTSYTSIWARCCQPYDTTKSLSTSYSSGLSYGYDYCTGGDCDYGDTAVGCAATCSSAYSSDFTGVRRSERDYNTAEYSGCNAQRSDSGYLWVSPYCASTDSSSELDCYTVNGDTTVLTDYDYSFSVVTCDDDNYELTGCSSHIDSEIASCLQPAYDDYGTNYGGWTYNGYCAAKGDYGIVAQATCCQMT